MLNKYSNLLNFDTSKAFVILEIKGLYAMKDTVLVAFEFGVVYAFVCGVDLRQ